MIELNGLIKVRQYTQLHESVVKGKGEIVERDWSKRMTKGMKE
jgi:hypothetical protein